PYLPPIGFISICEMAKHIQFEIDETYPKQTIKNHCNILTANGTQKLSIPVFRTLGSKSKTRDIQLLQNEHWQKIHWRALTTAYNKSPYFEHYGFRILNILKKQHLFLYQLNI
ncbi:WbqC family protein, partial [Arthrospira platensis SPKY1]|nr:WbqC family protein [Arthrospira platensis SPKY1]